MFPNRKWNWKIDHILVVSCWPSKTVFDKNDLIIDIERGEILKHREGKKSNIKNLGFCYYERKINA